MQAQFGILFYDSLEKQHLPLIPRPSRIDKTCRGCLRRPNGHRFLVLDLDYQGGQHVLVPMFFVRDEFHRAQDGHHIRVLQGYEQTFCLKRLCPFQDVPAHICSGIGLRTMVIGFASVFSLIFAGEFFCPRIFHMGYPKRGGNRVVR